MNRPELATPLPGGSRPPVRIPLTGARALITGASGGLGQALVRTFLASGAEVTAHHRGPEGALASLQQTNPGLDLVQGDLRDEDFLTDLFATGSFTVLVNNAGTYPRTPLATTGRVGFDEVVEANLSITWATLRHAALAMRDRGRSVGLPRPRGGAIVNIASLAATRASRDMLAYDAAKAAIVQLTRSAAVDLAPYGIRVNAVSPGLIDRPGLDRAWPDGVARWRERCPLGRLGTGEDVAHACAFLASDLASFVTGQELVVDGGAGIAPPY